MDLGLKGKTALVSGGSRGVGRAIAAALLREGARVVISGRNAQRSPARPAARFTRRRPISGAMPK